MPRDVKQAKNFHQTQQTPEDMPRRSQLKYVCPSCLPTHGFAFVKQVNVSQTCEHPDVDTAPGKANGLHGYLFLLIAYFYEEEMRSIINTALLQLSWCIPRANLPNNAH